MTKLLFLSTVLLPGLFNAQTVSHNVLAADGGSAQSAQGSIAWTIGEPVSETYSAASNITTMGFIQPEAIDIVSLIREYGDDRHILIYPNPVKEELSINFKGVNDGRYALELTDALGKLIYKSDADVSETKNRFNINVNDVAAGAYFLRVTNKDLNKVIKINKVN